MGDTLSRGNTVVACFALRRIYRDQIQLVAGRPVVYLFLRGDKATIQNRMSLREGHYMPASLLDSQIATLEEPGADEQAIAIDIRNSPEAIVDAFDVGSARCENDAGSYHEWGWRLNEGRRRLTDCVLMAAILFR